MAKRESRGQKNNWIARVLVLAVIALIVLVSVQEKHGFDFGLPKLPTSGFIQNLFADSPAALQVSNIVTGAASDDANKAPLRVHFIDVGQGKSILIETTEKNVLIDAGENERGQAVLRYLASNGIKQLDIAIGTHPHSDHIGGLDQVIDAMPVKRVILPVVPQAVVPTTPTYTDLLSSISKAGLKITPATSGDEYELAEGIKLTILGPTKAYEDLNDLSIVSRLDFGETSFLFTGDATAKAEHDMQDAGLNLAANVLDVGHHGSETSTSAGFLNEVAPKISVVSCGVDNQHGHPHRDVMRRLESITDMKILRTDLDGNIIISSDGKTYGIVTEKNK